MLLYLRQKQILKTVTNFPKNIHDFLKAVFLISSNSLRLNCLFFSDSVHLSKSILPNFSLLESMLINYKSMSGTLIFTASVTPYGSVYISPITNNGPQKIKNSMFYVYTHRKLKLYGKNTKHMSI